MVLCLDHCLHTCGVPPLICRIGASRVNVHQVCLYLVLRLFTKPLRICLLCVVHVFPLVTELLKIEQLSKNRLKSKQTNSGGFK